MISNVNQKKINHFRSQHRLSEDNYIFACQAAVPLVLTPDLLYHLWNNFKLFYYIDEPQKSYRISHIAVSDLLLSNLCREVGFEVYEMENEVRKILLTDLVLLLGEKRKNTIAAFLEEFAAHDYRTMHRQNLKDLHQLTALSFLSPHKMEEKIIEKINNSNTDSEKIRHLLLHNTLMPVGLRSDLKEISHVVATNKDYNNLSPILIEADKEGDLGVLKVELPTILNDKIQRVVRKEKQEISTNEIDESSALQIIHEAKEKRLTRLDLGNCGLKELPKELFELVWLEELILSSKWQEYSSNNKIGQSYTSNNKGEANHIENFPQELGGLIELRKLITCGNVDSSWGLFDLTSLIKLVKLEVLNISATNVMNISPLSNLAQLQQLNISNTQVSDLSPLKDLIQLKQLDVSNTQVKDLSPLKNLIQLQQLDVSNKLDLTPLKDLKQLSLEMPQESIMSFGELGFAPLLVSLDKLPTKLVSPLLEIANQSAKKALFSFVPLADATFEVNSDGNNYILTLRHSIIPMFFAQASPEVFILSLKKFAAYQRLLEMNNPNTDLNEGDIDIYVDVIEGIMLNAENLDKLTSGNPMLNNPQKVTAHYINDRQPAIKVKIISRNRALHVCALYMGKKYSIKQYLSGKTTQINKTDDGEWLRFPLEDRANGGYKYADTIPLLFDKTFHTFGWSEIEDYIKVFISTSPFDMKYFEQSEIMFQKELVTRETGIEYREADTPMDNDWFSITLPIKIVRPMPNAGVKISEEQPTTILGTKIVAPKGFTSNINMASRATIMQSKSGDSLGKTARNASFTPEEIDLQRALFPPTAMWGDSLAGGTLMSRAGFGVPNTDQQIYFMELSEVKGQLSPEQPLLVTTPEPLSAGETIIPFSYDSDSDFYVPIGFTDEEGTVRIEQLPKATSGKIFDDTSTINKQSIGISIKILFAKVKSKFTGDNTQAYNSLTLYKQDENGTIQKTANPKVGLEQKKNIVLLIHGIFDGTEVLVNAIFYHTQLHEQFDAVLSYDYENLNTDLRETGKDLKNKLEKAGLFLSTEKKLTIVAHSMGGLVSRWFIEHEGGDVFVKKLIQVGTPNAGLEISNFRDSIFSLLTWSMNGADYLKPHIGVLSFMSRFKDKNICYTLMQMSPTKSDFLPELNSNAKQKPTTAYYLIIGNSSLSTSATHPNDSFWIKVMENIKQDGKYALANRLTFKNAKENDVLVSVASARSIPWLKPTHIHIVECDHMSYFLHPSGLNVLEEVLKENKIIEDSENNLKQYLFDLIREEKLKEIFDTLRPIEYTQSKDFFDQLILLHGRFNRNEQENLSGLLDTRDYNIEYNQIVNKLISLIKSEFDESKIPENTVVPRESGPVKILMMTSLPTNNSGMPIYREFSSISYELRKKPDKFEFTIQSAVNKIEFKQLIETTKPEILHFSGNWVYSADIEGNLVLHNVDKNDYELLLPEQLEILFKFFKSTFQIQVVILNSRLSEGQAAAIAKYVPYVIGTTAMIKEDHSVAFSAGFYNKLVESKRDYLLAFNSGRTEAIIKGAKENDFFLYKEGKLYDFKSKTTKLIFIHGTGQEQIDATVLRFYWLDALREGLGKNNLTLPSNIKVELPYYADVIKGYNDDPSTIPPPISSTNSELNITSIVKEEIYDSDFPNELLQNLGNTEDRARGGTENWSVVRNLLKFFDKHTNWGEGLLETFSKDVYLYLNNKGVQDSINQILLEKFDDDDCVVVGHSLGSIMSYVLLSKNSHLRVKKLITLGSQLGMETIIKMLPQPIKMPACIQNGWYNAYDNRDIVALNELTFSRFPVIPAIINKTNVDNQTDNRHGIVGYLNDAEVAKEIYIALTM